MMLRTKVITVLVLCLAALARGMPQAVTDENKEISQEKRETAVPKSDQTKPNPTALDVFENELKNVKTLPVSAKKPEFSVLSYIWDNRGYRSSDVDDKAFWFMTHHMYKQLVGLPPRPPYLHESTERITRSAKAQGATTLNQSPTYINENRKPRLQPLDIHVPEPPPSAGHTILHQSPTYINEENPPNLSITKSVARRHSFAPDGTISITRKQRNAETSDPVKIVSRREAQSKKNGVIVSQSPTYINEGARDVVETADPVKIVSRREAQSKKDGVIVSQSPTYINEGARDVVETADPVKIVSRREAQSKDGVIVSQSPTYINEGTSVLRTPGVPRCSKVHTIEICH